MAKPTVHTSATVRDITRMAKIALERIREKPHKDLENDPVFCKALGEEAADKVDWKHLTNNS